MFLTVYLSNNEQHFTEVPVTPETLCRDVVDLCKEPGESECHLAEVWCGAGRGRPSFPRGLGRGRGPCSRPPARREAAEERVRRESAFSAAAWRRGVLALFLLCPTGKTPQRDRR